MDTTATYMNPVINDPSDHGDPAVLRYGGKFYLYHTATTDVPVYESTDLVRWEKRGIAFRADPGSSWCQVAIWAPEVTYHDGKFSMYLTGARLERGTNDRDDDRFRFIGVAVSDSPFGPFVPEKYPLTDEWSIDAHPFRDPDSGKLYLFYNVRNVWTLGPGNVIGCGNVYDEMRDPLSLSGFTRLVVKPEFPFEGAAHREGAWYWNEGPFVLKRGRTFHQIYSAGFFGDDSYRMYDATTDQELSSQRPIWTKHVDRPLLVTNEHCLGPGHCNVTEGPDGRSLYIVYHAYVPGGVGKGRRVWVSRFGFRDDFPVVDEPDGNARELPRVARLDLRGKDMRETADLLSDIGTAARILPANPGLPGDFLFEAWVRSKSGAAVSLTLATSGGELPVTVASSAVRLGGAQFPVKGPAIDLKNVHRLVFERAGTRLSIRLDGVDAGFSELPGALKAVKLQSGSEFDAVILDW